MFSKVFAAITSSGAETHLPSSTHLKPGNLTTLCMWSVEKDRYSRPEKKGSSGTVEVPTSYYQLHRAHPTALGWVFVGDLHP